MHMHMHVHVQFSRKFIAACTTSHHCISSTLSRCSVSHSTTTWMRQWWSEHSRFSRCAGYQKKKKEEEEDQNEQAPIKNTQDRNSFILGYCGCRRRRMVYLSTSSSEQKWLSVSTLTLVTLHICIS